VVRIRGGECRNEPPREGGRLRNNHAPSPLESGQPRPVSDDEFLEYQRRENQEHQPGELQLVLDPEFL